MEQCFRVPVFRRKKARIWLKHLIKRFLIQNMQDFKVNCFFAILDVINMSIEAHFTQLQSHINSIVFLPSLIISLSPMELRKKCMRLEDSLTLGYRWWSTLWRYQVSRSTNGFRFVTKTSFDLHYIGKGMSALLPNLYIELRIMLTFPVASGERNFSRLKLIKNILSKTRLKLPIWNGSNSGGVSRRFIETKTRLYKCTRRPRE